MSLPPRRPLVLLALLVTLCSWRPAAAQDQELSPEELREQRTIERFQKILRSVPATASRWTGCTVITSNAARSNN